MPPAVLLVSNYSNRTGYAWNNIHELYSELARACRARGVRVLVSFQTIEGDVDCVDANEVDHFLELPPAPGTIREYAVWVRAVRAERIAYVYLTDQRLVTWQYALLRACGVRRIVVHSRTSVPDPLPARPETGIRGAAKWLFSRLPWFAADRIYAVSDFVRNRLLLKARFRSDRVFTIINGVDLDRFRPVASTPVEPIRIFAGCRATFHKGVDVLIRAAAQVPELDEECPPFRIQYAGDGPDMLAFQELAATLGVESRFEFLGELPVTDDLVAEADIVVVPSVWGDACPSAVSEALAAGKALIATRVGGVPELVGDEGNALLVEHGNPTALARALILLMRDRALRESLGRKGRLRAERALDKRRYHQEVRTRLLEDFGL